MKRILLLILGLLLCASLWGCGSRVSDVDVDLAAMSGTVVFGEVSRMVMNPQDFDGKTVRMAGFFNVGERPGSEDRFYACMISDATACCKQGMPFLLAGAEYPQDYPELGEEITVVGTFETYQEDGLTMYRVAEAHLEG